MLVPEPTVMVTSPPEPDEDDPLAIPLLPVFAVPVLNDRAPDMPDDSALFVKIDMPPKLVPVPEPDEITIDPPEGRFTPASDCCPSSTCVALSRG